MSKTLSRRAAATAFAKGKTPETRCALTFQGNFAYSYEEPIAVREGKRLRVTSRTFSMTTSHHRTYVAGAWAIENGTETVEDIDHTLLRSLAHTQGLRMGSRGA